jgi:hypothetical protein
MAGNENSGGYRPTAPQNNTGVSATGGNGSASGVPNIDYTGFAYGENQAINQQMGAAQMGTPSMQAPSIPALPEVTPITAPSETPNRPITYGMPFGEGAGPEVNPLPVGLATAQDPSHQIIRALYQQDPRNEDLRYLVETMDAQQQFQGQ